MQFPRLTLLLVAALLAGVFLVGCKDDRTTPISSILNHTEDYLDREVLIAGVVTRSHARDLGLVEAGAYQVDDGSGKIWVLTKSGAPDEGREVAVKGTVAGGPKVHGEFLGTILKETDRRTR